MKRLLLAVALLTAPAALSGQDRTTQLVNIARTHMAANQFDSADAELRLALGSAGYTLDSVAVYVWLGILEHLRGRDSLTRVNFRLALLLHSNPGVRGLENISPALAELFDAETRAIRIYQAADVEQQASWRSGPPLAYPADLRRRRVGGHALVRAVIDTLGRVDERTLDVLDTPDSGFIIPLKHMMLAASFTPAKVKGHPVRSWVSYEFNLTPPAPQPPMRLIGDARQQLSAHRADSALVLLEQALDSANGATAGERVYALLVQGLARRATQRDSLASLSFDAGLAGYRELTARGVDLAPFLRRLADSIRLSRRPARASASPLARPTTLEPVDERPQLLSHPAIRYAPEMQALRVGGTVIVAATLDTTGRVVPASVRIVQSPNPAFDNEARRVVVAALYKPAQVRGRPARTTIRQPITFAPY